MNETNAIARLDRFAFEPSNAKDALDLCAQLIPTGLLPKHVKSPQAALLQLMLGREHGLSAMTSLTSMYVINGTPAIETDVLVALVRSSPVCEVLEPVEFGPEKCVVRAKRRGSTGEPITFAWTIEMAKKAGLAGKEVWSKYPQRMLLWRAYGDAIAALFSDVTNGIASYQEIAESEPIREERAPGLVSFMRDPGEPMPSVITAEYGEMVHVESLKDKLRSALAEPDDDETAQLKVQLKVLWDEFCKLAPDESMAKDLWMSRVGSFRDKCTVEQLRTRIECAQQLLGAAHAEEASSI